MASKDREMTHEGDEIPKDAVLIDIFRQELRIFRSSLETSKSQVLVFPSVLNSYSRLQLHNLVSEDFTNFLTLSFGKDKFRRCVVMPKDLAKDGETSEGSGESEHETLKEIKKYLGSDVKIVRPLTSSIKLDDLQHGCYVVSDVVNLDHVVELYGFPTSHKTGDLDKVLKKFRLSQYYEIVWVDDDHALAVMNDRVSAIEVLKINDALVKLRPFSEASNQSKLKASAVGLGVSVSGGKRRPKTSMVTANRLLSRALGLPVAGPKKQ